MQIRHILVAQKFEAEDVQRLLRQGTDFASLARRWSQCPSSKAGGDLGTLEGRHWETEFRQAAELLQPGQVSGIVRTPFGYHLIKRDT